MSSVTCALCGIDFSGRSDAVYCSGACRQKAHRARTAQRIANLRDRVNRDSADATNSIEATALRRAVADSMVRAREQVDRSRELCRTSAERLQHAAAIQRQYGKTRATEPANAEATAWRGN